MWRPLAARWPLKKLTVPHVCDFGHEVDMRQSAVRYAREVRWMLRCPVKGCDGYLWPTASKPAHDTVRAALAADRERLENRSAAPGCLPARPTQPTPTDCEESREMHTLSMERGTRGRQMSATLALFHLLEQKLPDASWRVDETGQLTGHVSRPGDDAQARIDVAAYAQFLGAHVQRSQGRDGGEEWLHLSAAAMYRGVAVAVWTHVDVRPVSGVTA